MCLLNFFYFNKRFSISAIFVFQIEKKETEATWPEGDRLKRIL